MDFDGNGELDDVDADATSANLEYAITEWAKNASDLIVYLTDHGGDGEFVLNNLGTQPDLVGVGSLDAWFDALQSENEARITFIYDACQSGTFVEGLLPPEGRDRIVLTSASNEAALFLERGVLSFSYQFWAAVFYKGQFYDAYLALETWLKKISDLSWMPMAMGLLMRKQILSSYKTSPSVGGGRCLRAPRAK